MKMVRASKAKTAVTAMLFFVQYPSSRWGIAVGSAERLLLSPSVGVGAITAVFAENLRRCACTVMI